jgi:hypothetical protein
MEENQAGERLKDLPIQAENPAFDAEEMILCKNCRRTNPPTRLECFYCAAPLEISAEQSKHIKPNLRKLETWEKGCNLILRNGAELKNDAKTQEIARLLNLETEALEKLLETKQSLPLVRVESEKEAEIIRERLAEFGLETSLLRDESFQMDKPQKRLRGLDFYDDKVVLILFSKDEIEEIKFEDLRLIVSGAIFERKVASTEKRSRKGENKILQSTETASDEFLFDIYSRENPIGYRIFAKGFDFSCLEAEKEILAKDNLKKLAEKLHNVAANSKYDRNYLRIRENLADVWNVEERNDSQGLKREGFGRFNLGNVTIINNSEQFTKYSRLQWQLL